MKNKFYIYFFIIIIFSAIIPLSSCNKVIPETNLTALGGKWNFEELYNAGYFQGISGEYGRERFINQGILQFKEGETGIYTYKGLDIPFSYNITDVTYNGEEMKTIGFEFSPGLPAQYSLIPFVYYTRAFNTNYGNYHIIANREDQLTFRIIYDNFAEIKLTRLEE